MGTAVEASNEVSIDFVPSAYDGDFFWNLG
jgi:hypothetical protein